MVGSLVILVPQAKPTAIRPWQQSHGLQGTPCCEPNGRTAVQGAQCRTNPLGGAKRAFANARLFERIGTAFAQRHRGFLQNAKHLDFVGIAGGARYSAASQGTLPASVPVRQTDRFPSLQVRPGTRYSQFWNDSRSLGILVLGCVTQVR